MTNRRKRVPETNLISLIQKVAQDDKVGGGSTRSIRLLQEQFIEFTESLGLKRPSRPLGPTNALTPQLNHGTKCHIQSLFKTHPGMVTPPFQWADHSSLYLSVKSFFLISNLYFPVTHLEAVSSGSVSCCLEKETNPHLATATFQGVVESDKVTPESPFLQAKHPQLPQLFLTGSVFQAPHQPRCPPLDVLQCLNVLPKLRGQNWTQHSRCGLTSAEYRARMTSLLLLATLFLIQARMPLAPRAHCWLMFSRLSPAPPGPFLPGHCPATPSLAYDTAGGYCGQNAGLST
uniref:uncharacterized protein LOC129117232 n=1 Tax=Agelaius phoeniceus TaxID=39638 RepID=UPI0023EAF845|nr:uncharacterized protein LOC129117232 [Agelaius phoeniceus]XP_054483773.1 uncharacterized protein LOC129117232 [Agelaius phoeniceus]